jgi:hypothetical protein
MASDDAGGWHDHVMPPISINTKRCKGKPPRHGVTGSEVGYRCMQDNWRTERRVFRISDAILAPGYFDQVDITEGPVEEPNQLIDCGGFLGKFASVLRLRGLVRAPMVVRSDERGAPNSFLIPSQSHHTAPGFSACFLAD